MRVNIYSQEVTEEVKGMAKRSDTGIVYSAVRLFLHSTPRLHHTPSDDDRSAITFWLPKSPERREQFAKTLERMAHVVRQSEPETGSD